VVSIGDALNLNASSYRERVPKECAFVHLVGVAHPGQAKAAEFQAVDLVSIRAAVEAARGAGVHLAFFSGNEVFWKTRWEASIDGSNTGFAGKVAVVTGAASFLGTAICRQLVGAGACVVLGDLDEGVGGQVAKDLGDFSQNSNEITLGWKWELADRTVFEFGLIENILNFNNSPDFGVHAGLTFRF
jgi:nucleoside-diphosphate-sugar epimerase